MAPHPSSPRSARVGAERERDPARRAAGSRRAASGDDGASPAEGALGALLRPLAFLAGEEPGASERLRDPERTLREAARRALALCIPRDLREALDAVAAAFARPLGPEARREAASGALARLAPWTLSGWARASLDRPLTCLPRVGPKRAEAFARRGLERVSDLLLHLPMRFDDRRHLASVGELEVGRPATFVAEVEACERLSLRGRYGYRRVLRARVRDESGRIDLKWSRAGDSLERQLAPGARLLVSGEVRRHRFSLELWHPEVELLEAEAEAAVLEGRPGEAGLRGLRRIVPVYPAPERVRPRTLRALVAAALDEYADCLPSHLPAAALREEPLPEPSQALRAIHRPSPDLSDRALEELEARRSPAHRRLMLEELFLLEAGLALRRAARASEPGVALDVASPRARRAAAELPFRLTRGQERAWAEIAADLGRERPMHRLLQGDVGSGKTAVAFLAAVTAAASGCQTALLAPTELLAEQHARTLADLAARSRPATSRPLRGALLSASLRRTEAEEVRRRLREGELDLVVGTHALLQEDVRFARLALAVVDEQHRFGVRQRAALRTRGPDGRTPHVLVMTATPIPRTLALTLYGDLDVSVIDELPPGRAPVETLLLREGEGMRVVELVRATAARGEQTYVVYPLVEESEKVDLRAAAQSAERIRAAFPDLRVDLVHGRLDAAARGAAMRRFAAGETHVLVSTTVVEVGVDVPNATLMVVEHAERFGLAQLHQLRGRVGRGGLPGTCVLVARGGGEESEARLRAMLETRDGFRIADADLAIRGPGEFLGTRQHGRLPDLAWADLLRDPRLVARAREAALEVVRDDPELRRRPGLRAAVDARWGERLTLLEVG